MWGVPPKLFYTLRFAGPPGLPLGSSLGSLELPQTSERFPKGLYKCFYMPFERPPEGNLEAFQMR